MPKPKPNKKLVIVASVIAVWIAIFIVWWSRRPPNLENEARSLLQAMLTADGKTLVSFAFEEEIEANGLTQQKLERVFKEIVLPSLSKYTRSSKATSDNLGPQGIADIEIRNQFQRKFAFGADVYPVDGSTRSPVLRHVLIAWTMRYYAEHNEAFSLAGRTRAVLEGVRADKRKLAEIGITSISDVNPQSGELILLPLDKLENQYSAWLEDQLKTQPPS